MVHDDTAGNSKNMEDDIDVTDAIEVIRWYQFFVAAKVFRALMGLEERIAKDDLATDDIFTGTGLADEDQLDIIGDDADG